MTSSDLEHVRRTWTRLAEVDPLWAVLSDPAKRGGRWDVGDFFRSGEVEIATVLAQLDLLGVAVTFGRSLDFGSGVGRLTQPLARRFAESHGIDIAKPMVELARRYDRERADGRCQFHASRDPDLRRFTDASFDFVYSRVVLQHMPPASAAVYMRDFVRVLRTGGVTMFQIPSERVDPPLKPGQSRGTGPLPERAFRATFELLSHLRVFRTGGTRTLRVRVGNAGPAPWPAVATADGRFAVHLANQWLAEDGTVIRLDDGRAEFPTDVRPDKLVKVPLKVTAPDQPGQYRLLLDVVQEGVGWFQHRGNEPLSLPVRVAEPAARPTDAADAVPSFEMHGTPRADVVALLEGAGADVVAVLDDTSAGPAWVSHIYVATKRRE